MQFLRVLRQIRRVIRELDWESVPEHLYDYVDECLTLYQDWFGPVPDPQYGIEVVLFSRTASSRAPLTREYKIYIDKSITAKEGQFASIAHEVFHRVTWHKWFTQELHLNEMLAFLVTQKALRAKGYRKHADENERRLRNRTDLPNGERLRDAKRFVPHAFAAPEYPDGFAEGVQLMGLELLSAVEWFQIARLIRSKSFQEWLEGFGPEKRNAAQSITGYASP